ncbi:MAG: hypothetical protein NUW37_15620 [Planctomycetes bacterium]|nr:hypothetical protein [Planctomycetota bacterium]
MKISNNAILRLFPEMILLVLAAGSASAQMFPGGFEVRENEDGSFSDERKAWIISADATNILGTTEASSMPSLLYHSANVGENLFGVRRPIGEESSEQWPYRRSQPIWVKAVPYFSDGFGSYPLRVPESWRASEPLPSPEDRRQMPEWNDQARLRSGPPSNYELFFDSAISHTGQRSLHFRWGYIYPGYLAMKDLGSDDPAIQNEARETLLDLGIGPMSREDGQVARGDPSIRSHSLFYDSVRFDQIKALSREMDRLRLAPANDQEKLIAETLVDFPSRFDGRRTTSDTLMDGSEYDREHDVDQQRIFARSARSYPLSSDRAYVLSAYVLTRHLELARANIILEVYGRARARNDAETLLTEIPLSEPILGDILGADGVSGNHSPADRDLDKIVSDYELRRFAADVTWRKITTPIFSLPPEAQSYRFRIEVKDLRSWGEIWIDDISLDESPVRYFQDTFDGELSRDNLPIGWIRSPNDPQRRLQPFSGAQMDQFVRRGNSGRSFKIETNGFNVSWQVARPPYILIRPEKTYTLEGWVRVKNLVNQSASIALATYDAMKRPIRRDGIPCEPGENVYRTESVRDSDFEIPWGATVSSWKQIRLRMEGLHRGVQYVKILLLVDGQHQDAHGEVWFEDVRLLDEPTVSLSLQRVSEAGRAMVEGDPTNILAIEEGGSIALLLTVDGVDENRFGYNYKLTIEDIAGSEVFSYDSLVDFDVNLRPLASDGNGHLATTVPLRRASSLKKGFYRLGFILRQGDEILTAEGGRTIHFAIVDENYLRTPASNEFHVVMDYRGQRRDTHIPNLLEHLQTGKVFLSLWNETEGAGIESRPIDFDSIGAFVRDIHVPQVVGVIGPELRGLTTGSGATNVRELLSDRSGRGDEEFLNTIAGVSSIIADFHIGGVSDESFTSRTSIAGDVASIDSLVRQKVGFGTIVYPLSLAKIVELGAAPIVPVTAATSLFVSNKLTSAEIETGLDLLSGIAKTPQVGIIEADVFNPQDPLTQASDLAKTVLMLRGAGINEVAIGNFHNSRRGAGGLVDENDKIEPLFVVWKVLGGLLSGTEIVDLDLEFANEDNLKSYVLSKDKPDGGKEYTLVIWPRGTRLVDEHLYIGSGAKLIDLFGNEKEITQDSRHPGRVVYSPTPEDGVRILRGIDSELLETYLDLGFGSTALESRRGNQTVTFSMKNHFRVPLTGSVNIAFPEGFLGGGSAAVRKFDVDVAPGQTFTKDFEITVPLNQFLGVQRIHVEASVAADKNYSLMKEAKLNIESVVTLPDMVEIVTTESTGQMQAAFRIENRAAGAMNLTCVFTSEGERFPQQQLNIAAGASTIVAYPVAQRLVQGRGGAAQLRQSLEGKEAVLILRQQSGGDVFINARYRFAYDGRTDTLYLKRSESESGAQ